MDGKYFLFSDTKSANIWDLSTREIRPLDENNIEFVAATPDNGYILIGQKLNQTAQLKLLDFKTGSQLHTIMIQGSISFYYFVSINTEIKDSKDFDDNLYTVSDNTITFWRIIKTKIEKDKIYEVNKDSGKFTAFTVSNDNEDMISATSVNPNLNRIQFWKTEKRDKLHEINTKNEVYANAISPNKNYFVFTSANVYQSWVTHIKICCMKTLDLITVISEPHTEVIKCLCISPNGKYIVSGSIDQNLRRWSLENSTPDLNFDEIRSSELKSLETSNKGEVIVGRNDGSLVKWDINEEVVDVLKSHDQQINAICYSKNSEIFAEDNYFIYGKNKNDIDNVKLDSNMIITAIGLSDEAQYFSFGTIDGNISILDISDIIF